MTTRCWWTPAVSPCLGYPGRQICFVASFSALQSESSNGRRLAVAPVDGKFKPFVNEQLWRESQNLPREVGDYQEDRDSDQVKNCAWYVSWLWKPLNCVSSKVFQLCCDDIGPGDLSYLLIHSNRKLPGLSSGQFLRRYREGGHPDQPAAAAGHPAGQPQHRHYMYPLSTPLSSLPVMPPPSAPPPWTTTWQRPFSSCGWIK